MVVLTYSECDKLTVIDNHIYDALKMLLASRDHSSIVKKMETGDIKNIGIVTFIKKDIPYEVEIGNRISFRCLGYTYSYDEFKQFLE